MATILRFVDPDDLTTVRLDLSTLNANPSATSGFGVLGDSDLGDADLDVEFLESPSELGGVPTSPLEPSKDSVFVLECKATNLTNLRALMRSLGTELRRSGVLEWRIDGLASSVYIDTHPSPIPDLLTNDEYRNLATVGQFHLTDLPVIIRRQPFYREAVVAGSAQTINNGVGNREILITNSGNLPSPTKVTITPTTGNLCLCRYGIRSKGNLTEYRTKYGTAGTVTLTGSTSSDVGDRTTANGNQAVNTAFSSPDLSKRFRDVRTFTDATCMEGVHKAYLGVMENGGTTPGKYWVQLRYGFSTGTNVNIANKRVKLDWREVSSQTFIEIDMGLLTIPKGVTTLVLEVWAERISGDASLAFDRNIVLMPADEHLGTLAVPGFRMGGFAPIRYDADQLSLNGGATFKNDKVILNALNEYAASKPAAGINLAAGTYELRAEVSVKDDPSAGDDEEIGELQVWKDTGAGLTLFKSVSLRAHRNKWWRAYRGRKARKLFFEVTSSDESTPNEFQFRVTHTAATAVNRKIHVHELELSFIPAISSSAPAVLDGLQRRSYAASGSITAFPLPHESSFPKAPPGDSVWVFQMLDLPTGPNYSDIDSREPSGHSVLTREGTAQVDIASRFSHG